MDVTSRESIAAVKEIIQEKEGKLHILVNKSVNSLTFLQPGFDRHSSAGQVGPTSPFLGDLLAPECKDAETLGQALFDNETPQQWADLYAINAFSVFFVTTAFLGLLDKGSRDVEGYSSSVINITSISGVIKLAQEHVRPIYPTQIRPATCCIYSLPIIVQRRQ